MYHIIFVCKYRKKLLIFNEKIIKELFIEISKNQDFIILEMECDKRIVTEICRLQGNIEDRDLVDQAFKDWYEAEDLLTNLVEGEV